jgi:signal transduction histidine kinase
MEDLRRQRNFMAVLSGLLVLLIIYLIIHAARDKNFISAQRSELHRLDLLNRSKDQLFSIVSHDLRGAVYSLQVNVYNLKSLLLKNLMADATITINNTERIVLSTQALLNNLLYWSLSQTGQISYRPERIALHALVDQASYDFLPVAASKNISFIKINNEKVYCNGDINTIRIILRNLIDNAIKFTPAGRSIKVSTWQAGASCFIAVQDTGIGMKKELIDNLFSHESNRVQQDAYGRRSTGIGLWLVKNMTEKNGGTLGIISQAETGTTITVTLPADPGKETESP